MKYYRFELTVPVDHVIGALGPLHRVLNVEIDYDRIDHDLYVIYRDTDPHTWILAEGSEELVDDNWIIVQCSEQDFVRMKKTVDFLRENLKINHFSPQFYVYEILEPGISEGENPHMLLKKYKKTWNEVAKEAKKVLPLR
ncbi:hypothetical protein SAMN05444392_12423 [Seinonella peptonophila]|uniref:Uncharacterized protein n=1 Tax=Seinonella peptonophila TaxID=112248 RepID=A0A1M5BJ14_9BACL|nr:hypothetical protein [Seinonella peptonophila]SHF42320.1 hypothetical protein SAMN05444392_12423 [Seinonella peptonophila]